MDTSSGVASSTSGQHISGSGSESDLRQLMDQRKRKRMISNRESARRSRLKKQTHLDGLMAQVAELRKDNQHILTGLNATTQNYMSVESDNAILRAQMAELSHRLRSLDEIVSLSSGGGERGDGGGGFLANVETAACEMDGFGNGYWGCMSQPIMMAASADHGFLF